MKNYDLLDAIGEVDAGCVQTAQEPIVFVDRKRKWVVALAAVLTMVLLATAAFLPAMLSGDDVTESESETSDPIVPSKPLTAEDVGNMFSSTSHGGEGSDPGTNDGAGVVSYYTVYWPTDRPMELSPLPTDQWVSVYRYNPQYKAISREELQAFCDRVMPKLSEALGQDLNSFEKVVEQEIVEREDYVRNDMKISYQKHEKDGKYNIDFSQKDGLCDDTDRIAENRLIFSNGGHSFSLNGKPIQIDIRESTEAHLASLDWVKGVMCEILGCSFDAVKTEYVYGNSGLVHFDVYYYNDNGTPQMGDYLRLAFGYSSSDEGEDPNIWKLGNIEYVNYRVPFEEYYTADGEYELLSLEEAEEMLHKGYVLQGCYSGCPVCGGEQAEVDFSSYDYVSFAYLRGNDGETTRLIPFYTFYKKIADGYRGHDRYAEAYVCALKLDGWEEYYRKKAEEYQASLAKAEPQSPLPFTAADVKRIEVSADNLNPGHERTVTAGEEIDSIISYVNQLTLTEIPEDYVFAYMGMEVHAKFYTHDGRVIELICHPELLSVDYDARYLKDNIGPLLMSDEGAAELQSLLLGK